MTGEQLEVSDRCPVRPAQHLWRTRSLVFAWCSVRRFGRRYVSECGDDVLGLTAWQTEYAESRDRWYRGGTRHQVKGDLRASVGEKSMSQLNKVK